MWSLPEKTGWDTCLGQQRGWHCTLIAKESEPMKSVRVVMRVQT